MRSSMFVFLLLFIGVSAWAQESKTTTEPNVKKGDVATAEDAKSIMLKADEAIKKVYYVKYDALFQGTGFMVKTAPTVKGQTIQRGKERTGYGQYRFDVQEAKYPGSEEKLSFVSGHDGKIYYLLDPQKKVAYVQPSKDKLGSKGRLGDAIGMQYFAHPEPFADDLAATSLRLVGTNKVVDEECWEIAVTYADPNKGKGVWYISRKDYLPRRMDRLVIHPETQEPGSMQWIFTNLNIVPAKENDVAYVLPDGYTESKDPVPQ